MSKIKNHNVYDIADYRPETKTDREHLLDILNRPEVDKETMALADKLRKHLGI
jgi:hypothetical protein